MKFLISVIDDKTNSASGDEMKAINIFNDELRSNGQFVLAAGLALPSKSTVIDNRAGANSFSDGPLIDSKEYLSGFWIVEAESSEVAKNLAAEGSKACNRKVELRPFLG
jgi:hypothetical protein